MTRIRSAVAAIASAAVLAAVGAQSTMGDASGHASCLGIEASSISPPGSSDEVPGGMAQLVAIVKADGKLGPVAHSLAQLHAGSHDACDAAFG